MYCVYWEYATEAADLTAVSLIQIVVWSFILILIWLAYNFIGFVTLIGL